MKDLKELAIIIKDFVAIKLLVERLKVLRICLFLASRYQEYLYI